MSRRELLLKLATVICAVAGLAPGSIGALAKSGGGSSGSGGGNSGSGGGGDDGGGDDGGGDDGGGDDGDGDGDTGKERRRRGEDDEHRRARKARNSGSARPLGEVLATVKSRYPGEVVSVSLKKGARLVYRVKLISRQGRLLRITVDASTASIIGVDGN